MPTEEEYIATIKDFDRPNLLKLWDQIEAGSTPEWGPGRAFEYLVLRAFDLEDDVEVRWPYPVRDSGMELEQIDGVVYAAGLACLVESKHQRDPLGIEAIAKLRNQLARRPSTSIGVIFSKSGFHDAAHFLARYLSPQTILLWEGSEVKHALESGRMVEGLTLKFRHAVEHGIPDYNLMESWTL